MSDAERASRVAMQRAGAPKVTVGGCSIEGCVRAYDVTHNANDEHRDAFGVSLPRPEFQPGDPMQEVVINLTAVLMRIAAQAGPGHWTWPIIDTACGAGTSEQAYNQVHQQREALDGH